MNIMSIFYLANLFSKPDFVYLPVFTLSRFKNQKCKGAGTARPPRPQSGLNLNNIEINRTFVLAKMTYFNQEC